MARVNATVTLWEEVLPIDRGERYEDPLDEALQAASLGEVTGGGTLLGADKSIEHVDIELELDDSEEAINTVLETLTGCGAPRHSRFTLQREGAEEERRFGVAEGVRIELARAPDDVDAFIERLADALGDQPDLRGGYTTQDGRYSVSAYDVDAEEVWRALEPVLRADASARGALIVVRYGHSDGKPRRFRLD